MELKDVKVISTKDYIEYQTLKFGNLKAGDLVKVKVTSEYISRMGPVDLNLPVEVVFFKTPHFIEPNGTFHAKGKHRLYCTFHQNGFYTLFAADKNIEYITEIVKVI